MLAKVIQKINSIDHNIINLSNKKKGILLSIISIFFFGIVLKLNMMTMMWSDDYMYSFIFTTTDKIHSFSDLVYSQYLHYMKWGGRTVGHTIVQVLLLLDPLWADIINSLGYIFLVMTIYCHAKGNSKQHDISLFILINLLLWFFLPHYGETILWITGSGNYMWCMLFILLYLLPYRLYQNKKQSIVPKIFSSLLMFILGIIAGWTNENVALAMILMALSFCFLYKKQKFSIPLWAIIGIISAVIGYCFLFFAPGNYERLVSAGATEINYNLFFVYFKFNMYTARLINAIGFIAMMSSILLIIALKFGKLERYYFLLLLFVYLIGVFIPVYAMIASPTFPNRAMFGTVVFSIIVWGIIYNKLSSDNVFIRYIRLSILALFMIAFVFHFYGAFKDVKKAKILWEERELYIQENVKNNVDSIQIPKIQIPYSNYAMWDGSWISKDLSNYYGINIEIY